MADATLRHQTNPAPIVRLPMPPRAWQRALGRGDCVVAGVSGGADSLHMALLLAEWARANDGRVVVVHVNHGHRGADDEGDAEHVAAFCASRGLAFVSRRMEGFAKGQPSLEERMRRARLAVLHDEAARAGAAAMALGHHADDVAESFLLMALRGAGAAGLGSLREARWLDRERRWLIRPNWSLRKRDLEATLRAADIAWRIDPTNAATSMRRNRLRVEVTPLLEAMEPAAIELLARSAELCAEVHDVADADACREMAAMTVVRGDGFVVLGADALRGKEPGGCKGVLRAAWTSVARDDPDESDAVLAPTGVWLDGVEQRIREDDEHESTFDPVGGVWVHATNRLVLLRAAGVVVERAWASCLSRRGCAVALEGGPSRMSVGEATGGLAAGDYHIDVPGHGAWIVRVRPIEAFDDDWSTAAYRSAAVASFDAEALEGDVALREVRAAETITLGRGGRKSAEEALREAGVPVAVRGRVLGLGDDRGLLWIPGVRRGNDALVTPRTRLVATMEWRARRGAGA